MKSNLMKLMTVPAIAFLTMYCGTQSGPVKEEAAARPVPAPQAQPAPQPEPPPVRATEPTPAPEPRAAQVPAPAPVQAAPKPVTTAPVATSSAVGATPAAAPDAAPAPPPPPKPIPPKPKTATLAAGTTLSVRTIDTLSTKTAQAGTPFTATLEEPLIANGWTIARKGATVQGRVAETDPGGRVKGVASLSVQLTSIAANDGQKIPITTGAYVADAKSTKGKDVKRGAVTTGVGAAIGAIAGGGRGAAIGAGAGAAAGVGTAVATKGDPAVIPSETVLRFQLASPVTVTQALKQP